MNKRYFLIKRSIKPANKIINHLKLKSSNDMQTTQNTQNQNTGQRWGRQSHKEAIRLITGEKTKGQGTFLGKKILVLPTSTQHELILPLVPGTTTFSTADFNAQWAEGRITLEEIHQVLGDLSNTLGFSFEKVKTQSVSFMANKKKIIQAFKDSLDSFLWQQDSKFAARGLQFRAGDLGIYITLKKIGPVQGGNTFAKFG